MAGKSEKIKLRSSGKKENGELTGTFYTTTKNKKGEGAKVKLRKKKFDPRAYDAKTGKIGCHVEFTEDKIK